MIDFQVVVGDPTKCSADVIVNMVDERRNSKENIN